MKQVLSPAVLAVAFTWATGCLSFRSAPNGIYSGTITLVQNGTAKPVDIILDSPDVRQLISAYAAKAAEIDHDLSREPHTLQYERDHIMPARTEFLTAMGRAPHITVKENTRCRMLEISKAQCSRIAEATITYVKVVITNGAYKDQQAWVCRNPYSLPFESP